MAVAGNAFIMVVIWKNAFKNDDHQISTQNISTKYASNTVISSEQLKRKGSLAINVYKVIRNGFNAMDLEVSWLAQ